MAPRVLTRVDGSKTRRRRRVECRDGNYFPGEVLRILGLRHLDYDHLHRLFELVRGAPRRKGDRKTWRRFTFTDLASLKVAAALVGADSKKVQRLRLKQLESVCRHLRKEFGLEHPLLHAKLRAVGSTIVVELRGLHFDASTTQRVFEELVADVTAYEKNLRKEGDVPRVRSARPKKLATPSVCEAAALTIAITRVAR